MQFMVIRDGTDYLVADASFGPRSAAMVPAKEAFAFTSRAEAIKQARKLSAQGTVPTRMIETPDRFEDVADTLYGPAWGDF